MIIAKNRLQCELMCATDTKSKTFEDRYTKAFDNKYFNFLLKKTVEIVDDITQHLPLTKIDEVEIFERVLSTLS